MTNIDKIERGRAAYLQQSWAEAYTVLSSADSENPLGGEDLELLAKAAYLIGKESNCIDIWTKAHQKFLDQKNMKRAAHSAFWLGMILSNKGDHAQGSGWMARAGRLVEEYQHECAERGLLLIPEGLQHMRKGEAEAAHGLFSKAVEIGKRFNNPDLVTLGRLGRGQALIQQNKLSEGTTLFDEAMIAVVSDEISPIVAGIVYCAVIETCQKIYDLQRAQEWTEALSRWCDSHPDLIPYRGQCLVRRAEIMQLHGDWPNAMNEVQRACQLSKSSSPPATGEAYYRQAELYRLQGNFSEAEDAYRQANKWGRNPQPGLALLRLAQGKNKSAKTAIRNVLDESQDQRERARILPAYVEIMLASGESQIAENTVDELSAIATELGAPFLQAIAARASGSILLANAKPSAAIKKLRQSYALLKKIQATYESARTQVLIGIACRRLGDSDTAEMELDAACATFQQLGAVPDINRVESLVQDSDSGTTHGLTPRELEVLRILATGKTNKSIAEDLFISERTVDRHVSNILSKLNVASRVAATAYAYKHNLV